MDKRVISGMLALVMVFQMCTGTSYAAEVIHAGTEIEEIERIEVIEGIESDYNTDYQASEIESTITSVTGAEPQTDIETMTAAEGQTQDESEDESKSETVSEKQSEILTEEGSQFEKEFAAEEESGLETASEIETYIEILQSPNEGDGEETEIYEEGEPDYLFQAGGFKVLNEDKGFESGISLFSTGDMDALADEIYEALKNKAEKVEVNNYKFDYNNTADRQQLMSVYYAVINDHPDLYYARTAYVITRNTESGMITKISPLYLDIDDEAFQAGVAKAKASVSEDMDDLQKAIAIHDYLVLNCEYDKERLADDTIPKESYSAYGVLANRIAVCQGYALAFKYLMNEYDIECYVVTSDEMNHAWNIVRIGDELYQLDATWDDPTWDQYGLVSHSYMFLSDTEFGKNHRNWYVTKGSGVIDVKAEGTNYDNAFWRNVKSPLVYDNSTTSKYYYVSRDKKLQSRSCSINQIDAAADTLITLDTQYSGLVLDNSRLYYNTSKKIAYIDVSKNSDGSYEEQVRYAVEDGSTDNIYGFTRSDNIVRYVKRASYALSGKSQIYSFDDSKDFIRYELGGGENNPQNPDKYNAETGDILLADPTREHYKFLGWYEDSDFKTKISVIEKGSAGNRTLYAKWAPKTYQIIYELSGGENSSQNPSAYTIETETITLENPTKRGCEFEGWYADPEYQTAVTSISIEEGNVEDRVIYAKWAAITYQITYELGNGENHSQNPSAYTIETETITLENPTKKGYKFEGWYADPEYGTNVTSIEEGSIGDRVLYAKWTLITYQITYELENGKNNSQNPSAYTVETETITLESPTRESYKFVGWYTDADYQTRITAIRNGSAEDITLYAKWEKCYYVRFYDGMGVLLSELEVAEGASVSAPEHSAPEGYEFISWDKDYANVQEDLDIKAVYKVKQYTITYVLKGGGNPAENPLTYTVETGSFQFADPVPNDTNMTFAGWYRDEAFQEQITSIEKGSTGDITVYAKWDGIWIDIADFSDGSRPYTGNAITFNGITVYNGQDILRPGIDYTVSYANNINAASAASVKAPAVVVTGIGNYEGKHARTFTICPIDIGDDSAVTIERMAVPYKKGKTQKPVPVVVWNGRKLAVGKDFEVSYTEVMSEEGEYEVSVIGKGNFTGTAKTSLIIASNSDVIAMSSVKIAKKIPAQTYASGGVIIDESMITLKCGAAKLAAGTDYEFDICEYHGAGTHYVTIRGKGGKYVGELVTTFDIKGTAVSQLKMDSVIYTGNVVKPVIKDKSGKILTEGTDYIINSLTGTEATGTAKASITGKGAYYGTATKKFKVKPCPINDDSVIIEFANGKNTQPYEKNGAKPKVTVIRNGRALMEGTDYTLSYKNNKKVGEMASVTIAGKKKYSAKQTVTFTVGSGSLEQTVVTVADKVVSAKKGGYVSVPVIKDSNGSKLAAGKDYDKNIIYRNNGFELDKRADRLAAGAQVTIEITGKGNYAGTKTSASYRILAAGKDLSKASVKVKTKQFYNGSSVLLSEDALTVRIGKVTLSAGDYCILPDTYVNNNKKGTAKVTIQGKGAYGGIKTISFKIYAQKMEKQR